MEDTDVKYREVPKGQLYLERVEAAAMGELTKAVIDRDLDLANRMIDLMERLSIL